MPVVCHSVLSNQPQSVHEISAWLYAPYQIDGGTIRLAGCALEDIGIVLVPSSSPDQTPQLFYVDGDKCDAKLFDQLELDRVENVNGLDFVIAQPSARRRYESRIGALLIEHQLRQKENISVVWCKWAAGKLVIEIGSQIEEFPFEGWARQFVEGPLRPPPFECKRTKLRSYHVTSDDEGTITVPDAIEQCELSGKRVVRSKLVSCVVTGTKALPGMLWQCPVSGEYLVDQKKLSCRSCRRPTNPKSLRLRLCLACRNLKPASLENDRFREVLERFPGLQKCTHVKVGEAGHRIVLVTKLDSKRIKLSIDRKSEFTAQVSKWPMGFRAMTSQQVQKWLSG
jgi:hypothetical protein